MEFRAVPVVFLLFLVAACLQPTPGPAPKADLAMEERTIRDLNERWLRAAQARDAGGEAGMYANDGVAYREHVEPLVGPPAIQAWSTMNYAENPGQRVSWTTDSILIASSGDLAVQTGEYHVIGLGSKGDREAKERFVTVWKKVGGEWKVAYDIGTTTMPNAPAEEKQQP